MIVAAALILAQSATALPLPANDDDIIVTARRLSNRWSGRVSVVNNETTCETTHSTGDDEFDGIGCSAMLKCWPAFSPRIEATLRGEVVAGRIKSRADMDKAYSRPPLRNLYLDLGKCIQPQIKQGIRAAIMRRRGDKK